MDNKYAISRIVFHKKIMLKHKLAKERGRISFNLSFLEKGGHVFQQKHGGSILLCVFLHPKVALATLTFGISDTPGGGCQYRQTHTWESSHQKVHLQGML